MSMSSMNIYGKALTTIQANRGQDTLCDEHS